MNNTYFLKEQAIALENSMKSDMSHMDKELIGLEKVLNRKKAEKYGYTREMKRSHKYNLMWFNYDDAA